LHCFPCQRVVNGLFWLANGTPSPCPSSCSRPQDFFHWGGRPASVSTSSRRGRWIRNEPARIRFDFREIGNWTSGVGTKVAEKNAFSSPYREQLNPLVEFSRPKTSAKSAGFGSPGAPEVRRPKFGWRREWDSN